MDREDSFLERGFLPKPDPVTNLIIEDSVGIMNLGKNIAPMLRNGSLRQIIDDLPIVDYADVSGFDVNLLMRTYSFLASSYVFANGDARNNAKKIPKGVAVPLVQLANKLDRPPILSYASYCLDNWKRKDPEKPIELGNIELQQNFLDISSEDGISDEDGFILVHVDIEARGSEILQGIEYAKIDRTERGIFTALNKILTGMSKINKTMKTMPEWCSPDSYWNRVRPYIFHFTNVVYEGVSTNPMNYCGETGAQSSLIPSIDAALGIKHKQSKLTDFLTEMRFYMPKNHREYIAELESIEDIRTSIEKMGNMPCHVDLYNSCVDQLHKFRLQHIKYAEKYIKDKDPNPIGTGGSYYEKFLGGLARETKSYIN